MGITKAPKNCFITTMPTENIDSSKDVIEYFVHINKKSFYFVFRTNHVNSKFVEENKYILKGLIFNNQFPYSKEDPYYTNERLEKLINEAIIPNKPKSKLDNLIVFLHSLQTLAGEAIEPSSDNQWEKTLCKLFFKNQKEYYFYLSTLKENGLITFIPASTLEGDDAIDIKITFKGLQYLLELQESGEKSKYCFVAMSFSENAFDTRKAIKDTIIETGFEPILVDEQHYESDITINDAIIKFIRMSRFMIADFTEQKHGVYFEAGFALGLGRIVIYTCSQSDFENTHFDTNHYPHIVYANLNDLKTKLQNKVLAWIK